jgi:hypothetical protein
MPQEANPRYLRPDFKGSGNCSNPLASALTDAVFGDEIVQFKGGTAHITRAMNGFWHERVPLHKSERLNSTRAADATISA